MRLLSACCAVIVLVSPVLGADRSLVLYLDGARVEDEAVITKEYAEIPLPLSIKDGSFRIKAFEGCLVTRVEVGSGEPDSQAVREMAKLSERRGILVDRLKALELRESIFTSAARLQSGKVPRRTKLNPEPLAAVRQGTEYAIAQLEGVYRARRIAESELKSLEEKVEVVKKGVKKPIARVGFSRRGCRVAFSYLRTDLKWLPVYDFRIDRAGEADVSMRALLPGVEKGVRASVVPAILAEADNETVLPVIDDCSNSVSSFIFPVEKEKYSSTPVSSITFRFTNQSSGKLPAGKASCFFMGEYMGWALFNGANPGESSDLTFGKL